MELEIDINLDQFKALLISSLSLGFRNGTEKLLTKERVREARFGFWVTGTERRFLQGFPNANFFALGCFHQRLIFPIAELLVVKGETATHHFLIDVEPVEREEADNPVIGFTLTIELKGFFQDFRF